MSVASQLILLDASGVTEAKALAARLGLQIVDASHLALAKSKNVDRFLRDQMPALPAFAFLYTEEGLLLTHITESQRLSIRADFFGSTVSYRREKGGGKNQMIAKAVGLRGKDSVSVIDATAGLGDDAFVLASLGCRLTLIERVKEVRILLEAGMSRAALWARDNDPVLSEIMQRMNLVEADATNYLQSIDEVDRPDVVYLDPMFPTRSKSALVKKEMRVFHQLVGEDPDADALLGLALKVARGRVVVKRPRIAAPLANEKPSHTLEGERNRFDVYMV